MRFSPLHKELLRLKPTNDKPHNTELTSAMNDRYGKLILERLIDVLNRGPEPQHPWSLQILQTILETPALDQGRDCQLLVDPQLTHPMAAYLETDRGQQVLPVMPSMWLHSNCAQTVFRS